MTPEDEPTGTPADKNPMAVNSGEHRRAIVIKAAKIGTAIPVVMTIGGRAALAGTSLTASAAASHK
jgi:hypothetical protein